MVVLKSNKYIGREAETATLLRTSSVFFQFVRWLRQLNRSTYVNFEYQKRPPSDEAVFKILYLALRNISKRWTMPIADWSGAMNQFAIIFEDRLPSSGFQNNAFTQSF